MSVIYPKIESTSLIQNQQEVTLEAILSALGGGGGGSISDLTLDQGTPSPGKKGPMNQAVATTALPSYSNLTVNPFSLTLNGLLRVDGSNVTQPVSGTVSAAQLGTWTVTANAGTNLNTSLLALDTSVNGILIPQSAVITGKSGPLIQGSVSTVAPAYTTGQVSPLSLTIGGLLRVDASASTLTANVTVVNGAGAAAVNIQDGGNSITVDGTVAVTQSTTPWVVSGSVTANAGTNLNTSLLALDTSVVALQVSQGSSTVGQKGNLVLGAVTTAAPTYTTAQSSPLSLTTGGLLRVDASGTSISGTVSVSNLPTTVDTNYGTVGASTLRSAAQIGNATGAALFGAGTTTAQVLRVVLPTDQTAIPVSQSGAWSVTANAGTNLNTSLLALESSQIAVQGTVAAGTAATKSELMGGVFNTALPSLTNGQQVALQLDASGRVIVAQDTASALNAQVVGAVASGGSNAGKPVKIGGVFNTAQPTVTNGLIVDLQTTNHGALIVGTGTDTFNAVVSGTVTANIGTTGGLALDTSVNGILLGQASTTLGQTGPLIQGAVTTANPSYTTLQTSPLSLTTAGGLRTTVNTITGTIVLPTGAATEATLVNVATDITAYTQRLASALIGSSVLASGSVTTAAPSYTTGQGNALSLTTSGLLRVDGSGATQPISGTVTANAGTNLNTSLLALDTSVNGILVSQGSTTVGEKGPLIQGAVTTSAPAYTTAQTSPLSLTTGGLLRTTVTNITGTIVLPTGASTETTLAAVSSTLTSAVNKYPQAPGSTNGIIALGIANSSAPSYSDGDTNPYSLTSNGAIRVDGSDVTQPVSIAAVVDIEGDTAAATTDTGKPVKIGGKASSTVPTAVTTGQRVNAFFDLNGRLRAGNTEYGTANLPNFYNNVAGVYEIPSMALGDPTAGLIAGVSGGASSTDPLNGLQMVGNTASGATDAGKPVKIGAIAKAYDATDPGQVTAGQRTDAKADLQGRIYINESNPRYFQTTNTWAVAQTNLQLQAAPGASLSLYVTDVIFSGSVAATFVLVEDTAGTPVTKMQTIYQAANGAFGYRFRQPIKLTANKNLGITTVAVGNHTATVNGYIAP